ncbi:MAG: PAS domain S-box protein [Chloroflexi bacterium]|nr:PAS domain S-box protein [Chloroflexota bacterium]
MSKRGKRMKDDPGKSSPAAVADQKPRVQENLRFLAAIVQSSQDAIISEALDGTITSWNPAAERMFGYSEKEALGKPMSIIAPPDRLGEFQEIIDKVKRGAKVEHYETQRRRKDGTIVDVSVTVSPVKDESGNLLGLSAVDRDITSQKQASQEALNLAAIVRSSEDAVISEALDGTITSWNPAAERMFGYTDKEALGRPMSIIAPPDRVDEFRQIIDKINKGAKVERYETQRMRRDGTIVDVSVTISPVKDENGNLLGLSAIDRDITLQKQASQYAQNLRFLAAIVQSSEDAVISEALDGTITSWNPAAERMFGYGEREALGRPMTIIGTPDRAHEFEEIIDKIKKGLTVERYETQRRRRNGTSVDVSVTVSPVRDEEGKLIGLSAIDRDITAQKQASQYARSLIEASLDPLVTISADGKITDVNEATIKATGIGRDNLIGTDFANYFTEAEKAREGYKQVLARGYVTDYPLTIRRKDGKLTDVLYNASVYKDVAGNVLGVFAAARDITAQKQASQYARSLIEASLDPLVTISPDGKITDVNEATIKVTGVSREKLIGTDFANYFTEAEKAREGYKQVLAKSYVTDYPLTIRHRDGKLTDVLYNASVYKDVAGGVLGVFAAARDITAQRKAEAQVAEQRTKELERLVELERFQRLTVGRELKMIELKKEIEELKKRVGESA